jgi:hypothetical protein
MEILRKNSIALFLWIISCFSFAQKKEIITYTRGFSTIVFYDDNTFLYREGPRRSMKTIGDLDSDTINHGIYIKETKCYILLYSYEKSLTEDTVLCKKMASIISKRKIALDDIVFYEWKYYHKKTKQQDSRTKSLSRKYNRHLLKYGVPPKPPRWQRAPQITP